MEMIHQQSMTMESVRTLAKSAAVIRVSTFGETFPMLVMKLIVGKIVAAGINQTTVILCISMHTRPLYWHWSPHVNLP
jgi:hypothetical protein